MMGEKGRNVNGIYADRPAYADLDAPNKFEAIKGIIMTRLRQHPKAICSYSGGSDSDILIDLIETCRKIVPSLPEVKYVFFNTGLEMRAIQNHVKEVSEKYGVEIESIRPKVNIIQATRKHGLPFISKIFSGRLERWQAKGIPIEIVDEFREAEDKKSKIKELEARYPNSKSCIEFLCSCDRNGKSMTNTQCVLGSRKYLYEFMKENPPDFKISAKCCDYCKKRAAHEVEKDFEMKITGERFAEGGARSVSYTTGTTQTMCFNQTHTGQYRFRPLYYVSDKDKDWYKETFNIRYSDAYEVYGLARTGCCGCPISYRAVADLELIKPYEPNLVKAAWNVFGKSYEYRQRYNAYKAEKTRDDKQIDGQLSWFDMEDAWA